jgi:acyl carrier protein
VIDDVRSTVSAALGLPIDSVGEDFELQAAESWDSMAHLRLVMALEEQFCVRFTDAELEELTSVASIARLIGAKTRAN